MNTLSSPQGQINHAKGLFPVVAQDTARSDLPAMRTAAATLSDEEREAHIFSCTQHMEASYARFQRFGVPGDRDAAIEFMRMRDAAMLTRSPAVKARMQAEVDRRIDEGVCYFSSDAAQALGRGGRA